MVKTLTRRICLINVQDLSEVGSCFDSSYDLSLFVSDQAV